MARHTRYVWKTNETSEEEIQEQKEYWTKQGYRTVILREGKGDIHEALKKIIKNHITVTNTFDEKITD